MKSLVFLSLIALLCLHATLAKDTTRNLQSSADLSELEALEAGMGSDILAEVSELEAELEAELNGSGLSDILAEAEAGLSDATIAELEELEGEVGKTVETVVAKLAANGTAGQIPISIVSKFRMNMTLDQYNTNNGSIQLIQSIATLLSIAEDFIKVLSVVEGSAVATTSVTTYSDNNDASIAANKAMMDSYATQMNTAANGGSWQPISGFAVADYSSTTEADTGSSKKGLSKAGIICLAVILPVVGITAIALGVFFYMKAKAAKKAMKVVHSATPHSGTSQIDMTSARPLNN